MALEHFITECRNTNKRLIKQELVSLYTAKYPALKQMLTFCYEPFRMYHINTKRMIVPPPGKEGAIDVWADFEFVLQEMERQFSIMKNRAMLSSLLARCNPETQELFLGIANKDLKAGFSAKIVNKVLPGLVNVFDVALAQLYDPNKTYNDLPHWWASKKLNGMRLVAMYLEEKWIVRTRNGKNITDRVKHLFPSFEKARQKGGYTFLDGEGYAHGIDPSRIAGDILGGEMDCSYVDFQVFAMGRNAAKFLQGDPTDITYPEQEVQCDLITFVSHIDIPNDSKRIIAFAKRMEDEGYEGAMLRNPDVPYALGRTNKMLKVKTWLLDKEKRREEALAVTCIAIKSSEQWRASKEDDKMIKVRTMESIEYEAPDGTTGKVGSGYTHIQRDEIHKNKSTYIGQKLDINFQQTGSKGGKIFPIFAIWRFDL